MTVYGLEGTGRIEGDEVWCEAYYGPVLFVCTVEGEMPVAKIGMVDRVPVRDLCEEGAGVGGKRVEKQSVEDKG